MERKSFWGAGIAVLLLIAMTILGSVLMYQTGWSRGYATGIVAAGAEDGSAVLTSPMYHSPGSSGALWGIGIFMLFGLGLLIVGGIGKACRMRAWHAMAGQPGMRSPGADKNWSRHWKGHHPPPFWRWHGSCHEQPDGHPDECQCEEHAEEKEE